MRHRIAKAPGPLERKPQLMLARAATPRATTTGAGGGWAGARISPHKSPRPT